MPTSYRPDGGSAKAVEPGLSLSLSRSNRFEKKASSRSSCHSKILPIAYSRLLLGIAYSPCFCMLLRNLTTTLEEGRTST